MTLVASAVAAMLRKDMTLVFQVEQRPVVVVATQDDATTLTAVATVGTAVRIVFHMLQVHAALTALTRAAHDFYVVYEIAFHTLFFLGLPRMS